MNAPLKVVRNQIRGDAFTRTCTLLIYCNYVALQNFWLLKNSIETELQNFWLLKNSIETELQNFWLLKNLIETECGFSRSGKLLFFVYFR